MRDATELMAGLPDIETPKVIKNLLPIGNKPRTESHDDKPGSDFNARGDIGALLEKHGWKKAQKRGDKQHWTRPGKEGGISATVFDDGGLYVFSSSAGKFEAGESYSPHMVYAILEHDGDLKKATKALAAQGYGKQSNLKVNGKKLVKVGEAESSGELPHVEEGDDSADTGWKIEDAIDEIANPPKRPEQIIEGIAYEQAKIILSAPSKGRKTFCLMHMGICIATGTPWHERQTRQGPVLYVNLELSRFSFYDRRRAICQKMGVELQAGQFHVLHLRGMRATVEELERRLYGLIGSGRYAAIIFDPLYKLLGARSENDASEMGDLLLRLEAIAHIAGAALIIATHFAKGNASGKEAMDRASGSGVIARDGDTIITLTPHEEDNCFTLDFILRDFAPIPASVLRWAYPTFEPDETLDPAALKQVNGKKKPDVTTDDILKQVTTTPQTRQTIEQQVCSATGRGERAVKQAFKQAWDSGLMAVESLRRKGTNPLFRFSLKASAQ